MDYSSWLDHETQTEGRGSKIRRGLQSRHVGVVFGLLLVTAAIGLSFPSPYLIDQPGPVFNVLGKDQGKAILEISGAPVYSTTGALNLMTVSQVGKPGQTPNWAQVFDAWIDPAKTVIPVDVAYPPSVSVDQVEKYSESLMQDSRESAVYVALSQLGYQIPAQLQAAYIESKGASQGLIKAGDLIVSADGAEVKTFADLLKVVQSTTPGESLTIGLIRDGKALTVKVIPKKIAGKIRIGLGLNYKYSFPIDVKFNLQDVSGPSGGTMFALGIYDLLTPGELTGGHNISGTGTIDFDGKVGPIGGIQQKMYSAVRAGSKWFLAPKSNCNEVVGFIPQGLNVTTVSTFAEALHAVEVIGSNSNTSALPTCTATK